MIHVVRKNETIEDLENIYNVRSDEIKKANFYNDHMSCRENNAIWIPLKNRLYFPSEEESLSKICKINRADINKVKALNKINHEKIPANVKVLLPDIDSMKFELSAIHKVTSGETSFVPIDIYGKTMSQVWIDGYDLLENNLNLPYDYPAIQASILHQIVPRFVLNDLHRYASDEIFNQLIHDLSYKEYDGGLLILNSENEIDDAYKIAQGLIDEKYDVSIAATIKILKAMNNTIHFKNIYYIAEKNIFDFDSFTENILSLKSRIPSDKLGIIYKKGIADINKNKLHIEYIHLKDIETIVANHNPPRITFDEKSQLCFLSYSVENDQHNVVFEDIRTFYAKADFLLRENINKIIIAQVDKEMIKYYGVLKELSFRD